ncbi:hypothetical protein EIN_327680 [Entamoeba invadens IP1]|uniref:Uncharacterized protein n=1 Tax=Entamoeba invadens IP1 TaxID=370355 RepID=A0A0A1U3C0_ENTIV|nr:hypothetical protein EIN_327680 [Entamoeba invadens IP1]ELP86111.1 hypothetical protein EIN_327680 [Entamoeba invadens IP1]|eukprot:XP_004185457.1 hypothetical protein EIN_327680 [Entamoeba invadens IP1]
MQPTEFVLYDCELQHPIKGGNQTLLGGCMVYETMKGVLGEEVTSLTVTRNNKSEVCYFTSLHGDLMLGACGREEFLPDVLEVMKESIIMRFGCYKVLKPNLKDSKDDDVTAKAKNLTLLNSPTFLPIVHSYSLHCTTCTSFFPISHVLYTPKVPCRAPTIAAFIKAMGHLSKRVTNNSLLGAALYLNREDFFSVASTLPTEIDHVVRIVAMALANGTMARKTTVSEIFLTVSQLNTLTASSVVMGKESYDKIKTTLLSLPIVCEECQLKKVKVVVTVNKGFVMVELLCWDISQEYLDQAETENLAGMEGLMQFEFLEGKKMPLNKVRIDEGTMTIEPPNLCGSRVNDNLLQTINREKILSQEGKDRILVCPTDDECYFCSCADKELFAFKTSIKEVDKSIF